MRRWWQKRFEDFVCLVFIIGVITVIWQAASFLASLIPEQTPEELQQQQNTAAKITEERYNRTSMILIIHGMPCLWVRGVGLISCDWSKYKAEKGIE